MQQSNFNKFDKLQSLVRNLWEETSKSNRLITALNLANEVIRILGIPENELDEPEEILNKAFSNARFKNQKMETWFEKHPFFGSGRIALQHYDKGTYPVETKFYQLNESFSKARVSATTQIEPNWEDNELTMLPGYKVGLDFFLDPKAKSLSLVITNQGNLRLMELSEKLTNTQIEIFNKLRNTFRLDGIEGKKEDELKYEPQRTIHQTLWSALELKEVNKRFYEGVSDLFELLSSHLEKQENLKKSILDLTKQSKQFANRLIGRILFLWFLNKKGVLSNKFNYFEINTESTEYYNKKLKILFYEVLNTPIEERKNTKDLETPYLNGGLFEPHFNDWNNLDFKFPDNWFNDFYKHLNEFNFTTDESSPEYEQVAIDPEMLGRVFENLLASIVPETSKAASERKNKGAFYTPREIVSFMCKESLKEHIKNSIENEKDYTGVDKLIEMSDSEFIQDKSTGTSMLWGNRSEEIKFKIIESLNKIKVLDPACGSGAFPIGFMQLMIKTLERLSTVVDLKNNEHRPAKSNEKFNIHNAKLSILKKSLFGSDIEPMAIEITKLRAWLSLVIDDVEQTEPLPNLEFNFVCANSLIPLTKVYQPSFFDDNSKEEEITKLRDEYFEAHNFKEKSKLRERFSQISQELNNKNNLGEKANLLKTWNPFKFDTPASFFDSSTMLNVDEFDIIIGNPPYINFEDIKQLSKEIYKPLSEKVYKTYEPRGDIYSLFYELGVLKVKQKGIVCYITSNKWMRTEYGSSLREYLVKNTNPSKIIDLGSGIFESAVVDTCVLVLRKSKYTKETKVGKLSKIDKEDTNIFKNLIYNNTFFKNEEMWLVMNEIDVSIKSKFDKYAKTLKDYPNLNIYYGIKTALNEAFIVDEKTKELILSITESDTEKNLTSNLFKKLLQGRDIEKNSINYKGKYLLLTHNGYTDLKGKYVKPIDVEKLKSLKKYLDSFGEKLENRKDQGYSKYNLRSCDYIDSFYKGKIIYSEIVRRPQFFLDLNSYFIDGSAYFITADNLEFLVNYLNHDIVAWVYKKFYAGGGLGDDGFRYKKVNLEKLPTPNLSKFNENIFKEVFNLTDKELDYIKDNQDIK